MQSRYFLAWPLHMAFAIANGRVLAEETLKMVKESVEQCASAAVEVMDAIQNGVDTVRGVPRRRAADALASAVVSCLRPAADAAALEANRAELAVIAMQTKVCVDGTVAGR